MKADLTKAKFGIDSKHRKENNFTQSVTLLCIDNDEIKELAVARWYYTGTRVYCCLWAYNVASGSGYAGGGGYHKASAAMQKALDSAGIELSEDIDGRGDSAIDNALRAIGWSLGYTYTKIVRAHG